MSAGWETKKLGDVIKLEYGKPLPRPKRKPDGAFPVYGANGENGRSDEYYFDKPSIIVGRKGTAGAVNLSEEKFWPLDVTYYVTFEYKKYDLTFLYYLLGFLNLPRLAKGIKPGINRNDVYALEVAVPPLEEQRRIVAVLDEVLAGVQQALDNTERNLENGRDLFDSHLQSIFTNPADDWKVQTLGEIGKTQYGLSQKMNVEGNGYKIFRMGELQNGRLIDTGSMKFADIDSTEFEKYKLYPGDVLFNRTNSYELVGKTGIFNLVGNYCFASYLIRLNLDKQIMLPQFLNYFMNSSIFQDSVKQKASRSINQANINATILSKERICFPKSLDEQRAIVAQLDALAAETQRLQAIHQQKLAALQELKQAILQQAFSGKLA